MTAQIVLNIGINYVILIAGSLVLLATGFLIGRKAYRQEKDFDKIISRLKKGTEVKILHSRRVSCLQRGVYSVLCIRVGSGDPSNLYTCTTRRYMDLITDQKIIIDGPAERTAYRGPTFTLVAPA